MATSSHHSFGPRPCSAGNIRTLVRPDGMRIPLHRELVPLSSMLIDVTEMRGHNLPAYGTWGAACRKIDDTNVWSDHAPGCAIDFDAPNNPYASTAWHRRNGNAVIFGKRVRTNIPQWVFELWEAHGFFCGVRYDSKPDPMHFSFVRSVGECRLITKRLQTYLRHPAAALPKPAPEQEDDDDMRHIVKGSDKTEWYITDSIHKRYVKTPEEAKVLAEAGASWKNGKPHVWPQPYVDRIPTV